MDKRTIWILAWLASVAPACASSSARPSVASSSGQASYASSYPEQLKAVAKRTRERHEQARALTAGFAAYPDSLRKPDPTLVPVIIDRADQAGRSAAFADEGRESAAVTRFFGDERDPIARRAGYAVQHAGKDKCDADLSGPIAYALKEGVDKQLEKRLRATNDAHLAIDRYRTTLGRDNVAALEKQADEIALASYLVHVELPEQRQRLAQLVGDAGAVRSTIDKFDKEERDLQADRARSDAEKRASEERVAAMAKTRGAIDEDVTDAKQLLKELDEQLPALRKQYAEALAGFKASVQGRGQAPARPRS